MRRPAAHPHNIRFMDGVMFERQVMKGGKRVRWIRYVQPTEIAQAVSLLCNRKPMRIYALREDDPSTIQRLKAQAQAAHE